MSCAPGSPGCCPSKTTSPNSMACCCACFSFASALAPASAFSPAVHCRTLTLGAATHLVPSATSHPPLTWSGVSAPGSAAAEDTHPAAFPARMLSPALIHHLPSPATNAYRSFLPTACHTARRFTIFSGFVSANTPMSCAPGSPGCCPSKTTSPKSTACCRASCSCAAALSSAATFSSAVHCRTITLGAATHALPSNASHPPLT